MDYHLCNLSNDTFFMGGVIRLLTVGELSLATFSASDLAICLALLSLFINQSLVGTQRNLDNDDKKEEMIVHALLCIIFAIVFLTLFTLIIVFGASVKDLGIEMLERPLQQCEIITFSFLPVMLKFAFSSQKSFRLEADLW